MFGKRDNLPKSTRIDTLVGQNSEIRGDLVFRGGLHVDGTVKGNVIGEDAESMLSLSDRGYIEGEIRVGRVVLNGAVSGDVHCSEHLELAANARVTGNVYYKTIEMARGARVNGNLMRQYESNEGAEAPLLLEEAATDS